jgi:hypothetical protein
MWNRVYTRASTLQRTRANSALPVEAEGEDVPEEFA